MRHHRRVRQGAVCLGAYASKDRLRLTEVQAASDSPSAGAIERGLRKSATKRSLRVGHRLLSTPNANGKRDDYVEPNQPLNPAKDKCWGYPLAMRARCTL